jgi:hypothetical protein
MKRTWVVGRFLGVFAFGLVVEVAFARIRLGSEQHQGRGSGKQKCGYGLHPRSPLLNSRRAQRKRQHQGLAALNPLALVARVNGGLSAASNSKANLDHS